MTESLQQLAAELKSHLPDIAQRSDGFARDVYESFEYWCFLARSASERDTQINYPVRAEGQLRWLAKLERALDSRSPEEQRFYHPLLLKSADLLRLVARMEVPEEGHQGFLRIVRRDFGFLQTEYGFGVSREEPTVLELSSGTVFVHLEYAGKSYLSCQFGPEPETGHFFCIRDILFLYDDGYQSVPEDIVLTSKTDVELWFKFVADVFRRHGHAILSNQAGIFDRLRDAQIKRDAEYIAARDAEAKKRL